MKKILVLTHTQDDTATMVTNHLEEMGCPFVRFDTDLFQSEIKLTMSLSSGGAFVGAYEFPDFTLPFEEIGIVWNRRVHDPTVLDLQDQPTLEKWALEESKYALYSSFSQFDIPVVNPWVSNERLAYDKIRQMRSASEMGFSVPETCLTNNTTKMKNFWEEMDGEIVLKKIRWGRLEFPNGKRFILHTSKVKPETMADSQLSRLRYCPMFYQKFIPKKYDVRSIIIGEKVYSVAIHSQDVPEGKIDFRTAGLLGKNSEMKHEIIDLGKSVDDNLVRLIKSFGLTFGAVDLVLTPSDDLVFLEVNPNGQWAWLEVLTGAPISHAFAEYFVSRSL